MDIDNAAKIQASQEKERSKEEQVPEGEQVLKKGQRPIEGLENKQKTEEMQISEDSQTHTFN